MENKLNKNEVGNKFNNTVELINTISTNKPIEKKLNTNEMGNRLDRGSDKNKRCYKI